MKDLGEFLTSIKEEIKNKTIRKIEVQEENKLKQVFYFNLFK